MEQKFKEKLIMADNEQGRIARDEILDRWEAVKREKQYFENFRIALKNCDEKHLYKTMEEFVGRELINEEKEGLLQLIENEKRFQAEVNKKDRLISRLKMRNNILQWAYGEKATD
ncbi:hypothetical protein ABE112_29015 [Priestia aryabhattai]|uniref:hypothetical protein n=1 Tax=Priestia aryabhattai TaxID=412384 RepID=UPI002E1C24E4|nr:hypothetical protein [Priestia aryabhattai]